jgi:hypothetical protein
MSQTSDKSAAISSVSVFTSFGPSSVGALYSHFLSGESELGFGDAVGVGVWENTDARLESHSKVETLAIAANFRFIGLVSDQRHVDLPGSRVLMQFSIVGLTTTRSEPS